MVKTPKSIAVVGGGTAGYISALILKKRFPSLKVSVISSSKIGIIGVGEGSTEHWRTFLNFLEVDFKEIIRECGSTCKSGIMFQDWTDKPYLHSIQSEYNQRFGQYPFFYGRQISQGYDSTELSSPLTWKNQVNRWFLDNLDECPTNQFHFNTNLLNSWLIKKSKELEIALFDDEINDFDISESGDITTLYGNKNKYNFDFYIDSTGFRRILISKLGAKWTSFKKYLKMKSAVVFPTEDEPNYNLWTISKAMDNGWLFRIPTWGRYGNGYIFDSEYITADQAKAEVDNYFGRDIEIAKSINFDPGCLDKVWINNCVAVGLSSSFVEPLEASSIGTSIQQSFLLMYRIINYDQTVIDTYNKECYNILENIRDFIFLHYLVKKDTSLFWQDIQNLEVPDKLKSRLDIWKHRLPSAEDFSGDSRFSLFAEDHYIMVMHGLGLFNIESIKNEFNMNPTNIKIQADSVSRENNRFRDTVARMTHKEYITELRNVK
jgi:flavin-dependent dehydrogenase